MEKKGNGCQKKGNNREITEETNTKVNGDMNRERNREISGA